MNSAIYRGHVVHSRREPVPHSFRSRISLLYLDLSELETMFAGRWLWSVERPNLASFRRRDYYGDPELPLDVAIRDLVESRTGKRPLGPVRLLAQPRQLGVCFNPVVFYYCFPQYGERPEAVVADVHNTPWNEQHAYVLPIAEGDPKLEVEQEKKFHVSPFMEMALSYRFRLQVPGPRLDLSIENRREGRPFFDARLALRREPLGGRSLARHLATHPAMSIEVVTQIYWQALRLWWKGAPYFPHPGTAPPEKESNRSWA